LVELKPPPQKLFADSAPSVGPANYLRFRLAPKSAIAIAARIKRAGEEFKGDQRELCLAEEEPSAASPYERFLGDAMAGDGALFSREDAVEAAWTVVDPVLTTHSEARIYDRGSWGPKEADDLMAAHGGWCNPMPREMPCVTKTAGLLPPNHYLSAAIFYLFQHRPNWRAEAAVGKTVVSTGMIDRVAAKLGRKLYEVPVGFKWFADGLLDGSLGFGGEESAGASFARLDGSVWTTDKDGIIPALLAAEITARTGRDPGQIYQDLTREFGEPAYDRVEAPATPEQKKLLAKFSPQQITITELAGKKIQTILIQAPGNDAPIGGVKVISESGWFAVRPSGTESIYKIYAESFQGADHLSRILEEAQALVSEALAIDTKEKI